MPDAETRTRATAHLLLVGTLVLGAATRTLAQDGANVLVVVNTAHAPAASIAARYLRARAIPADNVVRLTTGAGDEIDRAQYERQIERPIADWITNRAAQDRILYIVLIKGIPLRIGGTSGRQGTVASVDSELTLLYRRLVGVRVPVVGPVANPYFLGGRDLGEPTPFGHAEYDIYLVSRLDGFTAADVNGLIDRGASPGRSGTFLLDAMGPTAERIAERWLRSAAAALAGAGDKGRVVLEATPAAAVARRGVLGYASWGSNDPSLRARRLGVGFLPGALAMRLVSGDARTLVEPPAAWAPGAATDRRALYAGSSQSLAADLIRDGATGVAGSVAEPFLDGTIRPDILFPAYVAGANLGESFYLATPSLSWQSVVFGDPLCSPFRGRSLTREEALPPIDPETELPGHFAKRRVAQLASAGFSSEAVKLMLKAEARRRQGDTVGVRQALEQATGLEPGLVAAHRALAAAYDELGEHALAIERYRRVLAAAPDDLLSLNNLAYALAVHGKAPDEGLALAQRAYAAAKGSIPHVADTLGWIHYLLGQYAEAETYLVEAAAAAPGNADVQLHLAHLYAARGRQELATKALARTLQLDPAFANRDDVKALRARIGNR